MTKLNKLAFSASITGNDCFGIRCQTQWGEDVTDSEMVSAFVSLFDDISRDVNIRNLFIAAIHVRKDMMDDGIDSYTFAERKE